MAKARSDERAAHIGPKRPATAGRRRRPAGGYPRARRACPRACCGRPIAAAVPVASAAPIEVGDKLVIFHCRSGSRTQANARVSRPSSAATAPSWRAGSRRGRKAGLRRLDTKRLIEVMRQVQIAAGWLGAPWASCWVPSPRPGSCFLQASWRAGLPSPASPVGAAWRCCCPGHPGIASLLHAARTPAVA